MAGKHDSCPSLYRRNILARVSPSYAMSTCLPPAPGCGKSATIKGFVSVMESRFIGALFVAPDAIRRGIGSAAERGQTALPLAQSRGLPEKRSGGEFLPCARLPDRRLRMANTLQPTGLCIGRRIKRRKRQRRAVIFFQPRQRHIPGATVPSREVGISLVRTFTAPFCRYRPAGRYQARALR